jgi:predicted  nucleic acid-binding Zn-ribbon protein
MRAVAISGAVGRLDDGTVYFAPLGEMRYAEDRVQCHLCGRWLKLVGGSHLVRKHGITTGQYRELFHLYAVTTTAAPEFSARKSRRMRAKIVQGECRWPLPPTTRGSVGRWRSLGVLHPVLLDEWDRERNEGIDPFATAPGSRRKLWWRCRRCGHEWQTAARNRTVYRRGCPRCGKRSAARLAQARQRLVPRERSLAVRRPDLAAELHPTRNGELDPHTLGAASNQKVWWQCAACGHEWRTRVSDRMLAGHRCPACWGYLAGRPARVPRARSLGACQPALLARWHPERNGGLDPFAIGARSRYRVWWRCDECGHEWQSSPDAQTNKGGNGCPACARTRQRQVPRERSLAVKRPDLVRELHPTRNHDLDPYTLAAGSSQSVWWRCGTCGHEWQTSVHHRKGCPACARLRLSRTGAAASG